MKKYVIFLPRQLYSLYEQKFSNLRPLLSITFPQAFQKSKKFGHWTSKSGGKKTVKWSEKVWQTNEQTNKQTHMQTFRLIERIGIEGRFFENCFKMYAMSKSMVFVLKGRVGLAYTLNKWCQIPICSCLVMASLVTAIYPCQWAQTTFVILSKSCSG